MGLEGPRPGSSTLQATFCLASHVSGGRPSDATPAFKPRNCGQSAACDALVRRRAAPMTIVVRSIFLPMCECPELHHGDAEARRRSDGESGADKILRSLLRVSESPWFILWFLKS